MDNLKSILKEAAQQSMKLKHKNALGAKKQYKESIKARRAGMAISDKISKDTGESLAQQGGTNGALLDKVTGKYSALWINNGNGDTATSKAYKKAGHAVIKLNDIGSGETDAWKIV